MRVNILTFATPLTENEQCLPDFSRRSSGSTGNGTWMAGPDPPTTRAGGQDDVSYNKLPQIRSAENVKGCKDVEAARGVKSSKGVNVVHGAKGFNNFKGIKDVEGVEGIQGINGV